MVGSKLQAFFEKISKNLYLHKNQPKALENTLFIFYLLTKAIPCTNIVFNTTSYSYNAKEF